MSKHTPEPWEALDGDNGELFIFSSGCEVADVYEGNDETGGAQAQADRARIIACVNACAGLNPAAVAELVAACEAVTQQLVDVHAAIASQGLDDHFIDDSINMLSEGATAIDAARAALAKARQS